MPNYWRKALGLFCIAAFLQDKHVAFSNQSCGSVYMYMLITGYMDCFDVNCSVLRKYIKSFHGCNSCFCKARPLSLNLAYAHV